MAKQKKRRRGHKIISPLMSSHIVILILTAGILVLPSVSADHTIYSSVLEEKWEYAVVYIFIWNYPSNLLYLLYGIFVNRMHHLHAMEEQDYDSIPSIPPHSRKKEISLAAIYTAVITFIGANVDYYLPFNLTERWEGPHAVYIVARIDPIGFPIALGIIFLTFYLPLHLHLRIERRWAVLSASIATSMNALLWYVIANSRYILRDADLPVYLFYLTVVLYIVGILASLYYLKFWRIHEEIPEDVGAPISTD